MGYIYLTKNQPNMALTEFKLAVKYKPDFSYGYYNIGCAYLQLKKYSQARYNFFRSVDLRANEPNVYYNHAIRGNTTSTGYALAHYAMPVRAVYVPSFETCTLKVIVYWASTLKWTYNYICEVGQTVTIRQHPSQSGYKLSAWRENTYSGAELSTDNSYTVTLTGDQTIAAHYISVEQPSLLPLRRTLTTALCAGRTAIPTIRVLTLPQMRLLRLRRSLKAM